MVYFCILVIFNCGCKVFRENKEFSGRLKRLKQKAPFQKLMSEQLPKRGELKEKGQQGRVRLLTVN